MLVLAVLYLYAIGVWFGGWVWACVLCLNCWFGLRLRLGGFWVVVLDDVVFGGWVWCVVDACCSWWLVCLTCVVAVVYRGAWMCFVGLF